MLEKKKKITKKEIKQDTLVTSYYKAFGLYQQHQAKIFIGLGAIALIIVAVVLFSNKKANDDIVASGQLAKVMPLYESGVYEDAVNGQTAANIVGLKSIVDNYGSTEHGETAKIFLANCYLFLNKSKDAYELFNDYSGSNPLFKATALAGKAGYFESNNEYGKAADLYKDAAKISVSNPANADYLMRAGINLIKVDKKKEAKSIFENIKKEYKFSPVLQEIDRYIIEAES